jgi:hypothetical protein
VKGFESGAVAKSSTHTIAVYARFEVRDFIYFFSKLDQ